MLLTLDSYLLKRLQDDVKHSKQGLYTLYQ